MLKSPDKIFKVLELVLGIVTTLVALVKKAVDNFPGDEDVDEQ